LKKPLRVLGRITQLLTESLQLTANDDQTHPDRVAITDEYVAALNKSYLRLLCQLTYATLDELATVVYEGFADRAETEATHFREIEPILKRVSPCFFSYV